MLYNSRKHHQRTTPLRIASHDGTGSTKAFSELLINMAERIVLFQTAHFTGMESTYVFGFQILFYAPLALHCCVEVMLIVYYTKVFLSWVCLSGTLLFCSFIFRLIITFLVLCPH